MSNDARLRMSPQCRCSVESKRTIRCSPLRARMLRAPSRRGGSWPRKIARDFSLRAPTRRCRSMCGPPQRKGRAENWNLPSRVSGPPRTEPSRGVCAAIFRRATGGRRRCSTSSGTRPRERSNPVAKDIRRRRDASSNDGGAPRLPPLRQAPLRPRPLPSMPQSRDAWPLREPAAG